MPSEEEEQARPVRRYRVRELEPGMVLARNVHSSDGCVLLSEGDQLDIQDIERLKRWKKSYVYVYPPEDEGQGDSEEDMAGAT